jgi:hypothetical protein
MEKAERRVLVLANPGHGLENMKASAAIYLGMQLLLPGEWAPSAPPHPQRRAHDRGGRGRLHHGGRREVPHEPGRPHPHAHRPVARARPRRQSSPWCGWTCWTCRWSTTWRPVLRTSTAGASRCSPAGATSAYARGGVVPTPVFRAAPRPIRCCATPGPRRVPRCWRWPPTSPSWTRAGHLRQPRNG